MTRLSLPDLRLYDSWAEAVAEFGEEPVHGSGLPHGGGRLDVSRGACERLVARLRRMADVAVPLEDGLVHSDFYWLTDPGPDGSDEVVGFLAVRHALNEFLLNEGGHIGYSVRPSRRRQGHASRALGLALDRARDLGLERVLVTCATDNAASARTIESQGGVLEDVRRGRRRYWIAVG